MDYCKLNSMTIQDAYPLARFDEYFSTLDLLSGCWQVSLSPDAQEKAAFIIRNGP